MNTSGRCVASEFFEKCTHAGECEYRTMFSLIKCHGIQSNEILLYVCFEYGRAYNFHESYLIIWRNSLDHDILTILYKICVYN